MKQNRFSTCGIGTEADFWIFTKFVDLNATFAEVINVDVEAEFKLCYYPGNDTEVPCYANYFQVYVYRGPDDVKTYSPSTPGLNHVVTIYSPPLQNITNNTVVGTNWTRTNPTFSFSRNNSQGVVLALQSRGACGSIYRMKMYYYYCEEHFNNGVKFEKTASPAKGSNKVVKGHCTRNTIPYNNGTNLNGNCTYNGTWNVDDNVICTCHRNYELDRGIGICLRKLNVLSLSFYSERHLRQNTLLCIRSILNVPVFVASTVTRIFRRPCFFKNYLLKYNENGFLM